MSGMVLQVIHSLKELITWLEPMVSQLDGQGPVADTAEQLQAQCDWLKVNYHYYCGIITLLVYYSMLYYCILLYIIVYQTWGQVHLKVLK